jgi:hypothetical protein
MHIMKGYAEYILFRNNGNPIPIGFKNGFCVMDLECSDGGTAKFGCSNMGITAQCGDIYDAGLECQWIDITDVDPGDYILRYESIGINHPMLWVDQKRIIPITGLKYV